MKTPGAAMGAVLLSLCFLVSSPELVCQVKTGEKALREYVNVVNVELVLRVMKDGRSQGGFDRGDFRLFENGKECNINGFFEIRRKMAPVHRQNEGSAVSIRQPGRLFLLFFWGGGSENGVRTRLDYFFEKLYQPGDRIILGSDERSVEIGIPEQKERVKEEFLKSWADSVRRHDQELRFAVRDLNHALTDTINMLEAIDPNFPASIYAAKSSLNNLMQQYSISLREWDYRYNRFSPDSLERMAGDMITFYEECKLR